MKKEKTKKQLSKILSLALMCIFVLGVAILTVLKKPTILTYNSPLEKLSFKYPSNWKASNTNLPAPIGSLQSDILIITSPNGKIKISWVGAISGLGGGCDFNTKIEPGNQGCGLLELVEKDKLPNADLYFVEWIYTKDAINYTPHFALQSPTGYLSTTRTSLNVFTFQGKNNYLKFNDGSKNGPFDCVFTGGSVFQDKNTDFKSSTKEEALKFFLDPEMIQAKQILLSASY